MKKLVIFLIGFILILGAGLYLASGAILVKISDKLINYITENAGMPNLEYTRPIFRSARLSSWNALTWEDISLDARLVRNEVIRTSEDVSLRISEMSIRLENISRRTILLSAGGLSVKVKEKETGGDLPGTANAMEGGYLEIPISFPGWSRTDIATELSTLKKEIQRFATLGITKLPISFSATAKFEIQGKPCSARFAVLNRGEEYRLVMEKSDLDKIVALMTGKKPNPIDIAVIANNPLKASSLLKIRDKAETTAQLAAQQNPKIPEDAYRHTLWSYLLAKMYGEQFAKEVTDAHEAYADEEEIKKEGLINWTSASYQDLVNNALGRRYAALGYPESDILERVLFDPAIIRDKEAVKRFNALEYEKLKPVNFKPEYGPGKN